MAIDLPHYRQFLYFLVLHTIYIYIMIYVGMVMHVRFPMNFIYRGLTFYTMKIKITTFYSHVSLAFMSMIDTNDGIHEIR